MLSKKKKTLTAILGTFNKAIAELEQLVIQNDTTCERNGDVVRALEMQNKELAEETTGAQSALTNIKALISPAPAPVSEEERADESERAFEEMRESSENDKED